MFELQNKLSICHLQSISELDVISVMLAKPKVVEDRPFDQLWFTADESDVLPDCL